MGEIFKDNLNAIPNGCTKFPWNFFVRHYLRINKKNQHNSHTIWSEQTRKSLTMVCASPQFF